jgi:hypothetical protein
VNIHRVGIVLSFISGMLFLCAFSYPFVCSNFELKTDLLEKTKKSIDDPCPVVVEGVFLSMGSNFLLRKALTSSFVSYCKEGGTVREYSYKTLDKVLGSVPTPVGDMGWYSCVENEELHKTAISSCCEQSPPIDTCLKWSISQKLHVPLGDQYILGLIFLLFAEGSIFLSVLITIFSVLFPLSKVGLLFWLSVTSNKPKLYSTLKSTSRWSMTDVFVVGLLIVYFRADTFAFQFYAGVGVYFFAIAAILSSIGISLIYKNHRGEDVGKKAETEAK